MRIETTFRTSDDVNISYCECGEGKPLLFVHGWGASKNFWRHQIDYFSASFRVIAVDLRGHGLSDKPLEGDYRFNRFVKDILELIDYLKLGKFVYIGHSLGGMLGAVIANSSRGRISGLVLTGSPYDLRSNFNSVTFTIFSFLLKRARRLAAKVITPRLFAPETPEEVLNFVRKESANIPAEILIKVAKVNKNVDIRDQLKAIDVPTLIIAGEFDKPAPIKVQKKVAEMIKDSTFIILERCGHNLMLEKPDEFNEIVEKFLEKIGYIS